MRLSFLVMSFLLLLSCCKVKEAPLQQEVTANADYTAMVETFLEKTRKGQDTKTVRMQLAGASVNALEEELKTDAQRYAFWVNFYNAYIITILKENPELYEDKGDFFTRDQIPIAGETVSFDFIEHGILRKSQWKLGLGYFRKWFPSKLERTLRVDKRDYRIHFALNCGAKDCPPVAVYTPERIAEQFEKGSKAYLLKTTKIENGGDKVLVTPLFSWFRGDFGSKGGSKKILQSHGIISSTKGISIDYLGYDWTLDIDNFIDL